MENEGGVSAMLKKDFLELGKNDKKTNNYQHKHQVKEEFSIIP
jgi:hypothetical protein